MFNDFFKNKTEIKDSEVKNNINEVENKIIDSENKIQDSEKTYNQNSEVFKKEVYEKLIEKEQVKKKRGRPRKQEQEPDKLIINAIELERQRKEFDLMSRAFGKFVVLPLQIIIKRAYPDQPLTDEEKQEFIEASRMLAEKYAEYVFTYSVEINFSFVLGSILLTRMLEKREQEQIKEEIKKVENEIEKVKENEKVNEKKDA